MENTKDKPFEEKVKILKDMHAKSAPEALEQITQWEERFTMLKANKEWLDHPITKQLKELAEEQVAAVSALLSDKEDMSEIERKGLFALKKAHLVYLSVLTSNPESEMRSIEDSINDELKPI